MGDKTHKPHIIKTLISFFFVLTLLSCSTYRYSGGKNLYTSFYIGNNGSQYFIKPLSFKGSTSQTMELDLTFRVKKFILDNDSVTLNYTVTSLTPVKQTDSIAITSPSKRFVIHENFNRLFIKKSKKGNHSRFSVTTNLRPLSDLFQEANWTIVVFSPQGTTTLQTPKKTGKKLFSLNNNLFELIRE